MLSPGREGSVGYLGLVLREVGLYFVFLKLSGSVSARSSVLRC